MKKIYKCRNCNEFITRYEDNYKQINMSKCPICGYNSPDSGIENWADTRIITFDQDIEKSIVDGTFDETFFGIPNFRFYDRFNDCFSFSHTFQENNLNYQFRNLSDFFEFLAKTDEGENNPVLDRCSELFSLDKKLIYENDIGVNDKNIIAPIGFGYGAFWFGAELLVMVNFKIKIIGNMHQNSELLSNLPIK